MTANDKNILYNLLDTAQAYMHAIPKKPIPLFVDNAQSQTPKQPVTVADFNNQNQLESIAEKIANCQNCQLAKNRHFPVPGNGVAHPLVMIIGEGPGQDEDLSSQPFVGRAGQLLDKMMAAIQLSKKTNVFISNVVKCRPPQNRNPEPEETEACRSWLDAQIILLKPKAILALGKVASHNLLGISDTMSNMHGNFYDYCGIPVMPTYHPSALLRNESMKRPAWEDLKIFRTRLLTEEPGYNEPNFYERLENIPQMAYQKDSIFNKFQRQTPNYNH
jgi:DNA polymerase